MVTVNRLNRLQTSIRTEVDTLVSSARKLIERYRRNRTRKCNSATRRVIVSTVHRVQQLINMQQPNSQTNETSGATNKGKQIFLTSSKHPSDPLPHPRPTGRYLSKRFDGNAMTKEMTFEWLVTNSWTLAGHGHP